MEKEHIIILICTIILFIVYFTPLQRFFIRVMFSLYGVVLAYFIIMSRVNINTSIDLFIKMEAGSLQAVPEIVEYIYSVSYAFMAYSLINIILLYGLFRKKSKTTT